MKAGVPRRPSWLLDRPRLYELLDEPSAMTRIAAPAGAGKTALLTGWANAPGSPDILWVNAAPYSSILWPHLESLMMERSNARGSSSRGRGDDDVSIFSRLAAPLVLVIDNADYIDSLDADRLLDELAASPMLRVVLAGRDLRRLSSARALMHHDTRELPLASLDFTLDEMFAFLRGAGIVGHDSTVQLLHAMSGGNPAVLRAAMVEFSAHSQQLPSDAIRQIIDLVAATVLPGATDLSVDPGLLSFVYDTCVADSCNRALATELSGVPDPDPYLDASVALGLGSWLDNQTFAYSGAARLVFRSAAAQADPERTHRLGVRAARWARKRGHSQDAFRLAITNRDYVTACRQLRDGFYELLLVSRDETRVLLENVPRASLLEYPLLTFHLAVIYNAVRERRPLAREQFALALQGLRSQDSYESVADELHGRMIEGVCCRALGRPDQAVDTSRRALKLITQLTDDDEREYGRGLPGAVSQVGLTLLYAGEYNEAIEAFDEAQARAAPFTTGRLIGVSMAAGAHAILGEVEVARVEVAGVRSHTWPERIYEYGSSFLHLGEALLALEKGDTDATREAITSATHDTERFSPTDHWELIAWVESLADIIDRRPSSAVERIAAARARRSGMAIGGRLMHGVLSATRATAELAAGNPSDALATLDLHDHGNIPCAIARARVLLALDQPDQAISTLMRLAEEALTTRQRAEHAAIGLAARLRMSTDYAAQDIEKLVGILSIHGLRTPLLLLPDQDLQTIWSHANRVTLAQLGPPMESVLQHAEVVQLTKREMIVLGLLAHTGSAVEMADTLYVSVSTVKSQLSSIYRKLGVKSREQALAAASRVIPPARPDPD